MNNFDVNTGNPPPRKRYRIGYRLRSRNTGKPWIAGSLEVISRSPEAARDFARTIMESGQFEYEFSSCEDVTDV
jgi:hypothetical protein